MGRTAAACPAAHREPAFSSWPERESRRDQVTAAALPRRNVYLVAANTAAAVLAASG